MGFKIEVNKNKCVGSGDCVETASAVFALDDEGKSQVINPGGAADGTVLAAARSCPVKAITITREDGEQLFPPPKK